MEPLDRFIHAHEKDYEKALKEIRSGRKRTHWIWYIFPQLKALGTSEYSIYYGIENIFEAKLYLENDYLRNHLIEISQALLDLKSNHAREVLGYPDDLKVKSCMTLFQCADSSIAVFQQVLDQYYFGELDQQTISFIQKEQETELEEGKKMASHSIR